MKLCWKAMGGALESCVRGVRGTLGEAPSHTAI